MIRKGKYISLIFLELLLILLLFSGKFTKEEQMAGAGIYFVLSGILLWVYRRKKTEEKGREFNKLKKTAAPILFVSVFIPVGLLFCSGFFVDPLKTNLLSAGIVIMTSGYILREYILDKESL